MLNALIAKLFGGDPVTKRAKAIREDKDTKKEIQKDLDAYSEALGEVMDNDGVKGILNKIGKKLGEGIKDGMS